MCGRFGTTYTSSDIKEEYELSNTPLFEHAPRYNISPSQHIVAITKNSPLAVKRMYWGFVPSWADPGKSKFKPINARSDKLMDGFYRSDFTENRCLIPASWFYEWKKDTVDGEQIKIPYLIKPAKLKLFSFAGIYSIHKDAEGKKHLMAAIITTNANSQMKKIHDRMPVILHKDSYSDFLEGDSREVSRLLVPYVEKLEFLRVSTRVNNPENDDKSVVEPVGGR